MGVLHHSDPPPTGFWEKLYAAGVNVKLRINRVKVRSADEKNWKPMRRRIGAFLNATNYDFAFAALVFYNFLIIIIQTDSEAAHQPAAWWVELSNTVMLLCYIVDVIARVYVYRVSYFLEPMSVFDFSVVVADFMFFLIAAAGVEGMPSISFLRIARLCRMRRVLMMCPQLHKLGKSCMHAVSSIMWGLVILALMVTCWSILAVQWIHPMNTIVAERGWYDGCIDCPTAFSTVLRSNLTFFQQILAGDSWGQVSKPIIIEFPETVVFFIMVWVTIGLSVTNIILAAIVESATEAAADEKAVVAEQMKEERKAAEKELLHMCQEMDQDGSGNLTEAEINAGSQGEGDFAQLMVLLDIEQTDISMIFEMLDADGSGECSYEELVAALMKMKSNDTKSVVSFLKFYVEDIKKKLTWEMQNVRKDILAQFVNSSHNSEKAVSVEGVVDAQETLVKPVRNGSLAEVDLLPETIGINDSARQLYASQQQLEAANWSQLQSTLDDIRRMLADATVSGSLVNGATEERSKLISSPPPPRLPQRNLTDSGGWRKGPSPSDGEQLQTTSTPASPLNSKNDSPSPSYSRTSKYAAVTALIQEKRASIPSIK